MNFEAKGSTVYEDATIVKVPMSRILDKEGDPGDLLFDVAFDKLLKTDIIPSESKESLPISAKMIIFACVFGLILADTLNYEIYISIRICSKVWCL